MAGIGPLILMCNRSAIANNGFKTKKSKAPFYSDQHHLKYFSSMKIQASNTTNSENLDPFTEFGFKGYMDSKIKEVNEALDQTLPLQHSTKINEAMRYSLLSHGKRFRPILCLASCELVGGEEAQAMPIACAIEMIQAMSLMIDDFPCIDNDDVRCSTRKASFPQAQQVFGEETTILAGLSLVSFAFEHIAERTTNVEAKRIVRAIGELGSATGCDGMLGGQLLDLHCEGKEVRLSEVEYIHLQKSSTLIEASAVCGAIVGGGREMEIERLRRYGRHIGVMYQVVNDILDLTKSSEELGKTAKIDLLSDKATYPKFMSIDGAKKCVDVLMAQGMQQLSYFGATRTSPFYYLANYIANQLN